MNLTITALLVRERNSGEVMPLVIDGEQGRVVAFAGGLGSVDARQVSEAHERLRASSEEGRKLRAKYSHAMFMVENVVRASYEFPDEDKLTRDAQTTELLEARRQMQMADAELAGALSAVASAEAAITRRAAAGRRVLELEGRLGLVTGSTSAPTDDGGQSRASDLPPGGPSAPVAPHSVPQESGFVPTPETGANGLGNTMPAQPAVPVDDKGNPAPFPGNGKTVSTDPNAPRVETDRGETVEQPKPERRPRPAPSRSRQPRAKRRPRPATPKRPQARAMLAPVRQPRAARSSRPTVQRRPARLSTWAPPQSANANAQTIPAAVSAQPPRRRPPALAIGAGGLLLL